MSNFFEDVHFENYEHILLEYFECLLWRTGQIMLDNLWQGIYGCENSSFNQLKYEMKKYFHCLDSWVFKVMLNFSRQILKSNSLMFKVVNISTCPTSVRI
jgi:hypothetical protein